MKKQDITFWALIVSFVFGVASQWSIWMKFITIILSGIVLVQVIKKLFNVCRKKA